MSTNSRARSFGFFKGKYFFALQPLLAGFGCTQQTFSGETSENVESNAQGVCSVIVTPLRSTEIVQPTVIQTPRASNQSDGPWSFRALMEKMAPTAAQADVDRLVRSIFETWLNDQVVNGQTLPARATVEQVIMSQFEIAGSSPRRFDLSRAPYRLLAIATRLDLRSSTDAGELRFVYGFTQGTNPDEMTMNLEYKIPFTAQFDNANKWAAEIHALDGLDPAANPAAFAAQLQEITDIVTARGAAPAKP